MIVAPTKPALFNYVELVTAKAVNDGDEATLNHIQEFFPRAFGDVAEHMQRLQLTRFNSKAVTRQDCINSLFENCIFHFGCQ